MGNKRRIRQAILCLVVLALGISLAACRSTAIPPEVRRLPLEDDQAEGEQPENNASGVPIYYLDEANQRVVAVEFDVKVFLTEDTIKTLYRILVNQPSKEGLVSAIDPDTALLNVDIRSDLLILDLSPSFYDSADPVAARVALVNTMTSMEGINNVKITVEGRDLTYDGTEKGLPVGPVGAYVDDLAQVRTQDHQKLLDAQQIMDRELYFRDIRGDYFLPEVRTIHLDGRAVPILLAEALTQGPLDAKARFPVLPGDIQVLDCNEENGLATLYMSRSFIQTQMVAGQTEQSDLRIRVGALVLTITSLPDVNSVKFYYEDGIGGYTDAAVGGILFESPMSTEDFKSQIGRLIVLYFADSQKTTLVPEYRSVETGNRAIEQAVINELINGPLQQGDSDVIPSALKQSGISVQLEKSNSAVIVDLPADFDGNTLDSAGQRMLIYSIVNSLTDPINLPTVTQVRFTVGGSPAQTFGSVDISQPLTRNPSLIQQ